MRVAHHAAALVALILLVACGGGSGAAPTAAPTAAGPAPTSAPSAPASAAAPTGSADATSAAGTNARGPAVPADATGTLPPPLAPAVAVKVGVLRSLSDAGIYLAAERSYFREEGLDVSLEPFGSTAEMTAPLASGQLDVGAGAPTPSLFNA